jgi:hypothetical protein
MAVAASRNLHHQVSAARYRVAIFRHHCFGGGQQERRRDEQSQALGKSDFASRGLHGPFPL